MDSHGWLDSAQFVTFVALSVIDVLLSTAAGAAATAVGARAEGVAATSALLSLGARVGALKAGVLFVFGLAYFAPLNPIFKIVIGITLNGLATAVLLAVFVSQQALGEVSAALVIAAIVAAIPACKELRMGDIVLIHPVFGGIWNIGLVALAGYVFARMSHNLDLDICAWSSGAAAGAVYGSVTCLYHMVYDLCLEAQRRSAAVLQEASM